MAGQKSSALVPRWPEAGCGMRIRSGLAAGRGFWVWVALAWVSLGDLGVQQAGADALRWIVVGGYQSIYIRNGRVGSRLDIDFE